MTSQPQVLDTVFKSPRAFIEAGKISLAGLYEWNAKENPNYPLFRYYDGHNVCTITYSEAFRAIRCAASYVRSCVGNTKERIPVAILANADTPTYCCTSAGILLAGHIPFHISPRNHSAAVADLLQRTDCTHMIVSQDAHILGVARDAVKSLEGINLYPMKNFDELFAPDAPGQDEDFPQQYDIDDYEPGLILHSSGSTRHPKPIKWSHRRAVSYSTVAWYGEVNLEGTTFSAQGTPMFHAMGLCIYTLALGCGVIIGVFKPSTPPMVPTSENVFDDAIAIGTDYLSTVPAFVEEWSRDPVKVELMKKMMGITFGGAPLKQEIGDGLAKQGIALITFYGCTEVGTIAHFMPENPGMDWAYFTITPWLDTVQVEVGEGRYEIIVKSYPACPTNVVNTKVGEQDAYATNDLVVPHPTKPGLWRLFGRQDEQIVLSNGEKTNPIPIEHIINDDPHVATCIVFGTGRFQNGVLVQPKPEYTFHPEDREALVQFRNKIWPSVERANEFAPQHSRIFKEMILVTSPTKPFQFNVKGYPRRAPNLATYNDEIEVLYSEIERSAQSDVRAPAVWAEDTTAPFLRTVIERVLGHSVADNADLFRSGCDSLQATWIRNTIIRAVREHSDSAAKRLPMNVVFQAPSITALTRAVLGAVHGSGVSHSTVAAVTAEDLVERAERLSADLPPRPANLRPRTSTKDVVIVTGTTGGFGCDVLEHLLRDDQVARVYAFNRRGSKALERQHARFRERGLDEQLLESPKFVLVEAELDVPGFGLEEALLEEIRNSVTHIMHNAWRVNFSLSLSSFEVDLKGVRNLIELSLSSPFTVPPKVQFVSSIGIFENCKLPAPVSEVPVDPSSAIDTGYSESKWVAEKTLYNVSQKTGLPIVVVRLGQICGDRLGHWNETEWFPALIKSALFTRCLPDIDYTVSFIPSYPAARAFTEMRHSATPILHLVHPREAPWHTLVAPIAADLRVPLVPYARWLAALEACAAPDASAADGADVDAMRANPALHLLSFFREQSFAPGAVPLGMVKLSTASAERVSDALAQLPRLDADAGRRWIAAWRKSGFVAPAEQ